MNKLLTATLAGLALATGSAMAADIPLKAPPAPVTSWTGCYLAAGWGYNVWNQDHYSEAFPVIAPLSVSTTSGGRGFLGRFGGGCDYQLGFISNRIVIGALADYDVLSAKGTFADPLFGIQGSETQTGEWAVGGRVGYLVTPQLLTFFSAGFTQTRFGQVNFAGVAPPFAPTGTSISATTYRTGGFIGGGEEYALDWSWLPWRGLFWRTEYRYSSFASTDIPVIVNATGALAGTAEHMQKTEQSITTSLIWRFNWSGVKY